MTDLPPFPGFTDDAFAFLRELAENNDRDWFKPRKQTYEDEVQWPLRCLVVDAAREAAHGGLPLAGDPKGSLFRIYRDTRFSKDKRPYKTHAGAVLSRTGSRNDRGVVYIHVEPGQCFLGAGFWHPPMPLLRAWRERLVADPATFLAMQDALGRAGLQLGTDDALKRMPRGFEAYADDDVADVLRYKSYVVSRPVPDEALKTPAFTADVVRFAGEALPLLEYGWDVMGQGLPADR